MGFVANVMEGKDLEAYKIMSVENLKNCGEFKTPILKVYEMRQKVYRLQFKGAQKSPTYIYLDCARYLEETFEK